MSKSFFNFREEHGAGDDGSDQLVNKYKADTPGQGGDAGEKKQKARKGDMLQNKDEPEKSLKTEEVELDEKFSWNDVNKALTKANYMRGNPAEIEKVASKFNYKSGNDKKFSLADVKKNLSAAGVDAARQHNVMKHMNEQVENIMEGLPTEKFQSAEAKLVAYAKKNGGIDKRDFLEIAKMCGQIGRVNILQAGQVLARLNRKIDGLDTDVREKVFEILKSVQLMEHIELSEAKYTDKQIKMAYGIINDPRYKSGNMTAIVKKIEQIAKGLSKHPGVQKAIRVTNEDTDMEAIIDALIEEEMMEIEMLEESLNENWDETRMALSQLKFIEYAAEEIAEWMEEDMDDMPEWFQNKLTKAFVELQSLHSYVEGDRYDDDDEDEEEMDESTKAYGDTMRKQARDKQMSMIKDREKDKLMKIRQMLDKEKKRK